MESVTVQTDVVVNIYKVRDVEGQELSFSVSVDDDGDLIVELTESMAEESIGHCIEYIADNNLFHEVAEAACQGGSENMISAFCAHNMEAVVNSVKLYYDEFLEELNKHSDNDAVQMLKDLQKPEGE